MTRGAMVLDFFFQICTLFNQDVCTIKCNNYFITPMSSSSPLVALFSNGHAFLVPKGTNALDTKLHTRRKSCGTKNLIILVKMVLEP